MKLLVSDYDETINFHGMVRKEDIESLHYFYNQGNIISIASSRPYESLYVEMIKNNIPFNLLVCNNGNAIFNNHSLIDYHCLTLKELNVLRDLIKKLPMNSIIIPCDAYGESISSNPLYYNILLDNEQAFGEYYQMFCKNGFEVDYFLNKGIVFSGNIEKDYGVYYAIKEYGIKESDIYTIGDGDNDFSMLQKFNGYTFPWCSPKVRKLKLPIVNSIGEVINEIVR